MGQSDSKEQPGTTKEQKRSSIKPVKSEVSDMDHGEEQTSDNTVTRSETSTMSEPYIMIYNDNKDIKEKTIDIEEATESENEIKCKDSEKSEAHGGKAKQGKCKLFCMIGEAHGGKAKQGKCKQYFQRAKEIEEKMNTSKKQHTGAIVADKPNVHWDDIAGLNLVKESLKETATLIGRRKPWRGILLYGPPGTGKSSLAKAVATEAGSTFISISSADLVNERLVKDLFESAREKKPTVIFIDEVDSLCNSRSVSENGTTRRIKTEFLMQMQGWGVYNDGILVIGATNTPWGLDAAVRRQFEYRIYIPLPDKSTRKTMFELHIGDAPISLVAHDLYLLASTTDGYSFADIGTVVKEAMMMYVRKVQSATHFQKKKNGVFTPCGPTDQDAVEMSLNDVPNDKLEMTVSDFFESIMYKEHNLNKADPKRFEKFAKDFDQEGICQNIHSMEGNAKKKNSMKGDVQNISSTKETADSTRGYVNTPNSSLNSTSTRSVTAMEKAIDLVKKATEADNAKNYSEAMHFYEHAIDYFLHAMKYEAHGDRAKDSIRTKCAAYLERAEQLKKFLAKGKGKVHSHGSLHMFPSKPNTHRVSRKMLPDGAIVAVKPNVHWDDVVGMDLAKKAIKEAVILPVRFPHLFKGKRKPQRGILLYGPPGTGKSYLAKAVATEAGSTLLSISSADLVSKWIEMSECLMKDLFESARRKTPAIIFIDEVDLLHPKESMIMKIKEEFLEQMKKVESNDEIFVIGTTSEPWDLDVHIKRRLDRRIYIPLPDESARKRMFQILIGNTRSDMTIHDLSTLASTTVGYSCTDIDTVVREALMMPVRKVQSATHFKQVSGPSPTNPTQTVHDLMTPCSSQDQGAKEMSWMDIRGNALLEPKVTIKDFIKAIGKTQPTLNQADLKRYEEFKE